MSYYLGTQLKSNLMNGLPTRTKSAGDYTGEVIPPCGEFESSTRILSPPWLPKILKLSNEDLEVSQKLTLHNEIQLFLKYMEPTTRETELRLDLVKRFTTLIASFEANATIKPVGSSVTGLCLPTSDIDMVLTFGSGSISRYDFLSSNYSKYDLMNILNKIRRSGFASRVEDVLQASVPLIRITDKTTGLQIDLTAADTHGVKATEEVQKWMEQEARLVKALVTVVKMFLAIRKCGTTFTGGLNSYVLVWMVVAWVRLEWPKINRKSAATANNLSSLTSALHGLSVQPTAVRSTTSVAPPLAAAIKITEAARRPEDLGRALKGFFKFYGEDFDYFTQAIRIEPKPSYQPKIYSYSRYPTTQRYLLSIFDPADSTIDMGFKAYAIKHIQASFKEAYEIISRSERLPCPQSKLEYGNTGVLGKVLGGDFTHFVEKRDKFSRTFGHS